MEDYIFGTLITDELKLIYHRSRNSGLQHNSWLSPIRPQPDQPVTAMVLVGPDLDAEHIACYYTVDGSMPAGSFGEASNGQVVRFIPSKTVWDTMTWGYASIWRAEIPAQPEGTLVRYRIGAWTNGSEEIFADWPDSKHRQEVATHTHFTQQELVALDQFDTGTGKTFAYHLNRYEPPDWARQAVTYHIFVDRFHPGEGRKWAETGELDTRLGGTLWGVRDKLDHVQELGATAIWLSPTWPSSSYHGYDVTDYYAVSEKLGGEEAMRALVAEAHARGIRIILDLVCNHVSSQHPDFIEARRDPESQYRERFYFDQSEIGYRTFFGVPTMPQVNLQNPGAREWMIDIARFWLREYDVDGFRLDHANGPSPGFWSEFQAACKAEKPDCLCLGEVVEPSDNYLHYASRLDGLLDFALCDALRRGLGYGSYSEAQLQRFLQRHLDFFKDAGLLMPTFIDNHDMDRFLYIAGGDKDRLRRAAEVQFALPGPPIIYYGTEVGMLQRFRDSEVDGLVASREPMVWGEEQDRELFEFYRALVRKRRKERPWE